ncbi:MAG TPA: oligosaccharide flippase family protein [Thermoanaerobaculia bacterium]|nr:oligosaccharide flippase family protein [Thermoanaerobaculia bacterium]
MKGALRARADQVLASFRASRFARSAAMLAGGTAIAHGLTILAAPLLTRLYTPAEFGVLGVFTSFVLVASAVACARFDVAAVAAKERAEAASLTAAAVLVAIPGTLLATAILAFMVRRRILGFETLPTLGIALAGVAVFCTAVFTALRYWFIREEAFPLMSKIAVYQGIGRVAVQLVLGVAGAGWGGLVGGEIAARAAGIGNMARSAMRSIRDSGAGAMHAMRAAVHRHRAFALYSLPSTLVDTLSLQLVLPLLARYYGTAEAGEFTLVQRLLTVPLAFLSISIADTFHGRAATYAREQPQALRSLFLKTARALFLVGVGPIVAVMVLAPFTFEFIFGAEWKRAGLLTTIIAPLTLCQLVVAPISRIVFVVEKLLRRKLVSDAIVLSVVLLSFAGARALGLSVYGAVACYCASLIFAYVIYFLLMLHGLPPSNEVTS